MCYAFQEGLTNQEEDIIFAIEPKLCSIGTIDIPTIILLKLVTFGAHGNQKAHVETNNQTQNAKLDDNQFQPQV